MSSITPLLDTLVHQVMKQRTEVVLMPRQMLPVQAAVPTGTATEFSATGQQLARFLTLVQHHQQQPSAGSARAQQPTTPLFPASENLDAPRLSSQLRQTMEKSGLFYERAVQQWQQGKLPMPQLMRQPQMQQPAAQNQPLLQQQLELVQHGVLRWDVEPWPHALLQLAVQVDPHPLIKRWRERNENNAEVETPTWSTQLKITLPQLGEVRASIRWQPQHLQLKLQVADEHVSALRTELESLEQRLKNLGLQLDPVVVAGSALTAGGEHE